MFCVFCCFFSELTEAADLSCALSLPVSTSKYAQTCRWPQAICYMSAVFLWSPLFYGNVYVIFFIVFWVCFFFISYITKLCFLDPIQVPKPPCFYLPLVFTCSLCMIWLCLPCSEYKTECEPLKYSGLRPLAGTGTGCGGAFVFLHFIFTCLCHLFCLVLSRQ